MTAADRITSIERRAARIAWLKGLSPFIATVFAGVVLTIVVATCHRPTTKPVPPALGAALEQHTIANVIDSTTIHRLEAAAAASAVAQRTYAVAAARLDSSARVEHLRADSLVALAARATSAVDSAAWLQAAYGARTAEADSLRAEIIAKDTVILEANRRGDSLALALLVSKSMTTRANVVIAQAIDVVRKSDPPCRMLHFLGCPSRTSVAIGGALVGALAAVAAHQLVHTP